MFGKLLKNDLKAQFHSVYTIFFVIITSFTVLEVISVVSKQQTTVLLSSLGALLVMFFALVFVVISVAKMFSGTMFGKTGYLTLTLPVKTSSLIWSKTISGLVWVYVAFALLMASFFILSRNTISLMGEENLATVDSLLSMFGAPSLKTIAIFCVSFAIALAVSTLLIVQCLYFGITLSNVTPFSKLGKIGAIVFTFTVFYLLQKLSDGLGAAFPAGVVLTPETAIFTSDISGTLSKVHEDISPLAINFVSPLVRLTCALLLNIPTTYLVKKEVNVQ